MKEDYDDYDYKSKCKCGKPGKPDHTCPFAEDVHDDDVSQCNCCDSCQHECAMDI